jgi:hypothetical protein
MKYTKIAAFIFICIFAAVSICIHFLRPDLYFLKYPLSRYTIGAYGFILSSGFVCFALSEILLGFNILTINDKLNPQTVLLIIAATGVLLATFFSMDLNHKPSLGGNLHFTGAIIQFTAFPVFSFLLYKRPFMVLLKKYALLVSLITFLLCILMSVSIILKNDLLFSLSEKTDILVFTVWLLVVELKMLGCQS